VTTTTPFVTFVSFLDAFRFLRSVALLCSPVRAFVVQALRQSALVCSGLLQTPLLGFIKDLPLYQHQLVCPLPEASFLRWESATSPTRSVLVVPPDYDGFLQTSLYRSIAPCSQLWGSPRFQLPWTQAPLQKPTSLTAFPYGAVHTLRRLSLSDSRIASPRPLPPRCSTFHTSHSSTASSSSMFDTDGSQPRGFAPSSSPLHRFDVAA